MSDAFYVVVGVDEDGLRLVTRYHAFTGTETIDEYVSPNDHPNIS